MEDTVIFPVTSRLMPVRDVLRDSGTTHFGVGTNYMGTFFLTCIQTPGSQTALQYKPHLLHSEGRMSSSQSGCQELMKSKSSQSDQQGHLSQQQMHLLHNLLYNAPHENHLLFWHQLVFTPDSVIYSSITFDSFKHSEEYREKQDNATSKWKGGGCRDTDVIRTKCENNCKSSVKRETAWRDRWKN